MTLTLDDLAWFWMTLILDSFDDLDLAWVWVALPTFYFGGYDFMPILVLVMSLTFDLNLSSFASPKVKAIRPTRPTFDLGACYFTSMELGARHTGSQHLFTFIQWKA